MKNIHTYVTKFVFHRVRNVATLVVKLKTMEKIQAATLNIFAFCEKLVLCILNFMLVALHIILGEQC